MRVIEDRFWSNVDWSAGEEACWPWLSKLRGRGYGVFYLYGVARPGRGVAVIAHRLAWELHHAKRAPRLLDHTCRNKICVNPGHLRPATVKQNSENHSGPRKDNRTSGVRNVYWNNRINKWQVRVKHFGKEHSGGYFFDLDDAAVRAVELRNQLYTHNDADRV